MGIKIGASTETSSYSKILVRSLFFPPNSCLVILEILCIVAEHLPLTFVCIPLTFE